MTIRKLGFVQFKTHSVLVSKDDEDLRIYCFKHTNDRCDLASFDSEELAADYIISPMASVQYYVNIHED